MGDVSGGNGSMNIHIISQQYWDFNNGDVSCGIFFINSHTLSQCIYSIFFKEMDCFVENGDVSGGNGYMNSRILYQHNGLKPLNNYNTIDNIDMNADLKNNDASSGIFK